MNVRRIAFTVGMSLILTTIGAINLAAGIIGVGIFLCLSALIED